MTETPVAHRRVSASHEKAMAAVKASPRTHLPRHVTGHEVRQQIMGEHLMGRLNNWLAVQITRGVGTMWAAYIFVLIALVSFPQALAAFLNGDALTGVTWLSQSFLQLVLLPILLVGQRVIAAGQDARAETDHETLTALHTINVHQLEILETLADLRRQQAAKGASAAPGA